MAVLAVTALACLAPPATAAALLEPADATELAQQLAEAQDEQGVCYGWGVAGDVETVGSSTGGPGVFLAPDPAKCPRGFVLLRARVIYECSSCDNGDQADVRIEASIPRPPTPAELASLGFAPDSLAGDDDDQALVEMVGALPLLVAEHRQAPFVEYEAAGGADVPAADRATGSPGSDLIRAVAPAAGLGVLFILGGVGWFFYKRAQQR